MDRAEQDPRYNLILTILILTVGPCSSVEERVTCINTKIGNDEAQGSTPCGGTRYSQRNPFCLILASNIIQAKEYDCINT
jgi:hypothetical protein